MWNNDNVLDQETHSLLGRESNNVTATTNRSASTSSSSSSAVHSYSSQKGGSSTRLKVVAVMMGLGMIASLQVVMRQHSRTSELNYASTKTPQQFSSSSNNNHHGLSLPRHHLLEEDLHETMGFQVHNKYGLAKYGHEYPFIKDKYVAEPFKEVTFTAVGSILETAASFTWSIYKDKENDVGNVIVLHGQSAPVMLTKSGLHRVTLNAYDHDGKEMATHTAQFFSAYGKPVFFF
jgi:hypothetical protein